MIVRRVNDRNGNRTCELVEVGDRHLDERGIGSMVVSLESYETTFRAITAITAGFTQRISYIIRHFSSDILRF